MYVSIILILLTRVYSIPYFWYIAHSQKAQDKIYTEAVGYYLQRAKPGERLLVEQWAFFVEPVSQSNILVKKIHGKDHLQVEGIEDIVSNTFVSPETLKLYHFPKIPDRSIRIPRKNDYILTLTGDRQSPWKLRAVSPFFNKKESAFITQGMQLEEIMNKQISWKGLQVWCAPILPKFKEYSAGYKLYKVNDPTLIISWEGRWSDNWIGKKARCTLKVQEGNFIFTGFVPQYTIPTRLQIFRDGQMIKEVVLDKAGSFSFDLEISSPSEDGIINLEFHTEKAFNPKIMGLSDDNRDLSVQIEAKRVGGLQSK